MCMFIKKLKALQLFLLIAFWCFDDIKHKKNQRPLEVLVKKYNFLMNIVYKLKFNLQKTNSMR